MNCPFHMSIYNDDLHSYRDLPLKLYEFGTVYRYEQKGELGGLTRVRGFTQDDAHIICTREQVEKQMEEILDFAYFVLKETFGFEIDVYASFRDPKSDKYLGDDSSWELAENVIRKILQKKKRRLHRRNWGSSFLRTKNRLESKRLPREKMATFYGSI
jgi:threonyl-tRNA synthetase